MLRQMSERDPMLGAMLQNPEMMRMMLNPQFLQSMAGMQNAMRGAGGMPGAGMPGANASPPGSGTDTAGAPGAGAPGAPGANPMAAMMNDPAMMQAMMGMMGGQGGAGMGGMGGGMGGMGGAGGFPPAGGMGGAPAAAPAVADNRPPEERYSGQLEQLTAMGFPDTASNVQALVQANGDVNQAINFLLGGNN